MSIFNFATSDQAEAYALPRGGTEENRLRNQHPLFEDFAGGLVHKSISKSNIHRVADVATGSGIWLIDVAKLLKSPTNEYYGFDISTLQFPDKSDLHFGRFTLVEHDAKVSFPEKYHGQFDLVNVRLVVQALRADEVETVVANLTELLRPGGYLQWQDLEWRDIQADPPHPTIDGINSIVKQHMKVHGLSECFPILVESSMREIGFSEVNAEKSWHNASPLRAAGATAATTAALQSMLPKALETNLGRGGSGVDEAKVQRISDQLKLKLESLSGHGHNWKLSATIVIGRKV